VSSGGSHVHRPAAGPYVDYISATVQFVANHSAYRPPTVSQTGQRAFSFSGPIEPACASMLLNQPIIKRKTAQNMCSSDSHLHDDFSAKIILHFTILHFTLLSVISDFCLRLCFRP